MRCFLPLFARDRSAQFGIITALILFPMLGMVGAAVDLSYALRIKSDLAMAADSVLLNGVSAPTITNIYGNPYPSSFIINVLKARVERGFRRQVPDALQKKVTVTVIPGYSPDTGRIAIQMKYRVSVPTTFLKLVGMPSINFSTTATSVASMTRYADLHVMIDNSPSMLIGANETERARLFQMVLDYNLIRNRKNKPGCVFACHDLETDLTVRDDYYQVALGAGIKLRLDVVKDAVLSLLTTLSTVKSSSSDIRYSLYSFGDVVSYAANPLTTHIAAERIVQNVSQSVQTVMPAGVPTGGSQGYNATNMQGVLAELQLRIPASGNGYSASKRMQTLLIITDGVTNSTYTTNCPIAGTTYCIRPFDTASCKALRNRGVKIAILDVGYPAVSDSSHYDRWVGAFSATFPQGLKDCASPGLYQTVGENQNISQILRGLFDRSITSPRLTN